MTDIDLTPAVNAARAALGEWIEPQYGDLISPLNADRVLLAVIEAAAPVLLAGPLARIADQSRAINWDTTCTGCGEHLDAVYAQTMRAETAEAEARRLAARVAELDRNETSAIDDAIRNEEWADKLAAATAAHFGVDIGEHYPNRKAVLAAEKQAIISEKPLYNDKHNGGGIGKAKAIEPAKPVNHAEAVFAENYFILTADILETFPPNRIAAFMEEARRDAVAGDPAWAALTADSALLLGPAASIAWDEVYGSLTRIVEKVEAIWRALPEDARRETMATTQAEIKATPGLWTIHMPAILLGHIAAYWAAQAGGEA